MPTINFADVEHAANVDVRNLTGMAHFGVKSCERGSIFLQMIGQEFERDGLREFDVFGLVKFAHAAFAQQPLNAIPAGSNFSLSSRSSHDPWVEKDDKLKVVFGGKKQVSMFEMTKLVSKHLLNK